MLEVRLAKETEYNDVSKLSLQFEQEGSCWGQVHDESDYYQNKHLYVAYCNKVMVGYAYGSYETKTRSSSFYNENDKIFYLEEIYVSKEYRSSGIGTKLYEALERDAKKENCTAIELICASKDKVKAINFYQNQLGLTMWSVQFIKQI